MSEKEMPHDPQLEALLQGVAFAEADAVLAAAIAYAKAQEKYLKIFKDSYGSPDSQKLVEKPVRAANDALRVLMSAAVKFHVAGGERILSQKDESTAGRDPTDPSSDE